MTPAEAIAVVREALVQHTEGYFAQRDDALAALALIEQRMEDSDVAHARGYREGVRNEKGRAEAAERERDRLNKAMNEVGEIMEQRDRFQTRAEVAEARIAQLEEALAEACRDLCESPEKYLALASGKEEA